MATTTLLRDSHEGLNALEGIESLAGTSTISRDAAKPRQHSQHEPLLREALGMSLRAFRADKNVTLRELASQARVSSGYISELERGRKEVSSELLASICVALGTTVAEVLLEAVANLSLKAITDELENSAPVAAEVGR